MAAFDATRFDRARYDVNVPINAYRLQNTVNDFMDLVRNTSGYVSENRQMITQFCLLIDDDKNFPLAAQMVPELRLPQSHNSEENAIINEILRTPEIKRRRPKDRVPNPAHAAERELIRQRTRAMIMYLEYDREREEAAAAEQPEFDKDTVQNLANIISECLC